MTRPAIRAQSGDVEREYDALADLFLSDEPAPSPPAFIPTGRESTASPTKAAVPVASPGVELVLLGHLPVLGSAWVGPYAAHRAAALGRPVALVRLVDGLASLDLVPRVQGVSEADSLEEAVAEARPHVGGWIVRVASVAEARAAREPAVARVTMLTAANDPAVLASYRTIKSLAAGEVAITATLGVAIIGAGEEQASGAISRLAETVRSLLHRDLGRADRVRRVGACPMTAMYQGEWTGSVADLFTLLAMPHWATAPSLSLVRPADTDEPREAAATPPVVTPPPQRARGACAAGQLPGLELLGALCPLAPRVEVGVDATGSVNLVVAVTGEESVAQAVQELLAAGSWAESHGAVLSHVRREITCAEPVLHLLTDAAPRVRCVLDTRIRLHLLIDTGVDRVVRALN